MKRSARSSRTGFVLQRAVYTIPQSKVSQSTVSTAPSHRSSDPRLAALGGGIAEPASKLKSSRFTVSEVSPSRREAQQRVDSVSPRLLCSGGGQQLAKRGTRLLGLAICFLLLQAVAATLLAHSGHRASAPQSAEAQTHEESDRRWAELARDYPRFTVDPATLRTASKEELSVLGQWGPLIEWPLVAASAANLPDGRLLTWASWTEEDFGGGPAQTVVSVWDPQTGEFVEAPNDFHDMFCAGLAMLDDGRVFAVGGAQVRPTTSSFDFTSNSWVRHEDLNVGRWYPGTVFLPGGEVFTALGSGGGSLPELWTPQDGWRLLGGIDLENPVLSFTDFEKPWNWPQLHVAPNGEVFHSGPTPDMHFLRTTEEGSLRYAGRGADASGWYPRRGSILLFEEGRMLMTGGAVGPVDSSSTNRAALIEINGPTPVVTEIESMTHRRSFHSSIPLPTGDVFVVGGSTSGIPFNDETSVLTPEIFRPESLEFRPMADMQAPRNYHSVGLLLPDGRVWVGGGGLCGEDCPANQSSGQIFSPPYLFAPSGDLAVRPEILEAPAEIDPGQTFEVVATPEIVSFRLIRMSAATHGQNSDVRSIDVPAQEVEPGRYEVSASLNPAVLVPGYWMLFAVDEAGVPSVSASIRVRRPGRPLIFSPGGQLSFLEESPQLAILAFSPQGEALSFSAMGLPLGLTIESTTGTVSGLPTVAGEFDVTVTVTDAGGDSASTFFGWKVEESGSVNDSPVLAPIEDQISLVDRPVRLVAEAEDANRDPLRFVAFGLPSGIKINPSGAAVGSPRQIGVSEVSVSVYDGRGGSDTASFLWNIDTAIRNQAPKIRQPEDQLHFEGDAIDLRLEVSDPNGDLLTLSAEGLPPGVTLVSGTGVFSGTPLPGSADLYSVTVSASDGSLVAQETFPWGVLPAQTDWIDFVDESEARLQLESPEDSAEKDMAQGDLDGDGQIDLVVVRKEPFDALGPLPDLLLMNRGGVLVDETSTFAPGFFAFPTDARDVVIADFDGDAWLDVVIATTYEQAPRFYRNLGLSGDGTWLGLGDETAGRMPLAYDVDTLQFCSVAAGDVNGDGALDIYLSSYRLDFEVDDVLLINDGAGYFEEQSEERLQDLRTSAFGSSVQIVDMDGDGDQDIVKVSSRYAVGPWTKDGVFLLLNSGNGFFDEWIEFPSTAAYMHLAADLNNDGLLDVFVQDDQQDYVDLATRPGDQAPTFLQIDLGSARTAGHGGNLRLADLDRDGDLDLGLSDVDSMFPPCETGEESLRKFALLENRGAATAEFIDPWGGRQLPWSHNTFDFEFVDLDGDGWVEIVAGQCGGYAVYRGLGSSGLQLSGPLLLEPGETSAFEVSGATPGSTVRLLGSNRTGSTSVPGCPGVTSDMDRPRILGSKVADSDGFLVFEFAVPVGFDGTFYTQAVEADSCALSDRLTSDVR